MTPRDVIHRNAMSNNDTITWSEIILDVLLQHNGDNIDQII